MNKLAEWNRAVFVTGDRTLTVGDVSLAAHFRGEVEPTSRRLRAIGRLIEEATGIDRFTGAVRWFSSPFFYKCGRPHFFQMVRAFPTISIPRSRARSVSSSERRLSDLWCEASFFRQTRVWGEPFLSVVMSRSNWWSRTKCSTALRMA